MKKEKPDIKFLVVMLIIGLLAFVMFIVNNRVNQQAMILQSEAAKKGGGCKIGETAIANKKFCSKSSAMHLRGSSLCCKSEFVINTGYSPNSAGKGASEIINPLPVYYLKTDVAYNSGVDPCKRAYVQASVLRRLLDGNSLSTQTIIRKDLYRGYGCAEDVGTYTAQEAPTYNDTGVSNSYCVKCKCGTRGGAVGYDATKKKWYIICN